MPELAETTSILSLRCRDAEWLDCPEVVEAFARPIPTLPRERRDLAVGELLIADQQARRWLGIAAGGRPVLTCETARFGAAAAFERTQADLSDWTRWDELAGDLLFESEPGKVVELRPSSLSVRVRRSLAAIAAAVPMLTLSIAQASPPTATMVTAAPPKLPEDAAPKPVDPVTTTAPVVTEAPRVAEPPMPMVVPPAGNRDDSLSLTGRNLWEGLKDKSMVLIMKDGTELSGTLVAHSGKDLAVARTSDGTVVAVPKLDVTGIRVRTSAGGSTPDANRTGGVTQSGHKLAAGGGAMIGIGASAALAGTVMLGIYISYLFISLPLLLPGLAMVGGGIGLLASSKKKRAAYDKAWGITSGRNRLMPTFAASRQGGQAGLVLKF